jgi:hypothetical protein
VGHEAVARRETGEHALEWRERTAALRAAGADGADGLLGLDAEDLPVEEEQGPVGLVLCGGGDVQVEGQVGEEGADLGRAHVLECRLAWKRM